MSTYSIDDAHGTEICAGLSEHEARAAAQRWADRLGASVYLYEADSEAPAVEVAPTAGVTS